MTSPAISAIICTYERYDLLPRAIESLVQQSLPAMDFEILVVDNSPDHDFSQQFSLEYASVANLTWLVERKSGLSNARNVGVDAAAAPLVAFMDDDAIASPRWLQSLIAAFQEFGANAQAAGGRVDPIWSSPRPRWLHDDLLGYVSVVNWGGQARFAAPTEWLAGTNIAFRRNALLEVGGFSVNFGRNQAGHALLSNDEVEVLARLRAGGGRALYVPDAAVQHLVAPERLTQEWFRRRVAWQAISEYLQNPKDLFGKASGYWGEVTRFFAKLPPQYRTPRGFYVEQDDPETFCAQLSAIYNFSIALMAGFHGVGEHVA